MISSYLCNPICIIRWNILGHRVWYIYHKHVYNLKLGLQSMPWSGGHSGILLNARLRK